MPSEIQVGISRTGKRLLGTLPAPSTARKVIWRGGIPQRVARVDFSHGLNKPNRPFNRANLRLNPTGPTTLLSVPSQTNSGSSQNLPRGTYTSRGLVSQKHPLDTRLMDRDDSLVKKLKTGHASLDCELPVLFPLSPDSAINEGDLEP